jgi:hypothetical protein
MRAKKTMEDLVSSASLQANIAIQDLLSVKKDY